MRSKTAITLLFVASAVVIVFYLSVQHAIEVNSPTINDIGDLQRMLDEDNRAPEEVMSKSDMEFNNVVSTSDDVARYAKEYLQTYRDDHPSAYPITYGQLDLFGNSWIFNMWDGEKSDVILIYFDSKSNSVKENKFTFTKEALQREFTSH